MEEAFQWWLTNIYPSLILVETYLFTENLTRVTPEMREHIVNQLRVATLIAKLDANNDEIASA